MPPSTDDDDGAKPDDANPNPNRSISTSIRKKPTHRASILDVFRRHKSSSRDSEPAADNNDGDHPAPHPHQQPHKPNLKPQRPVPPIPHPLPHGGGGKSTIPHSNPLASNPVHHHRNTPFLTVSAAADRRDAPPDPVYANPLTTGSSNSNSTNNNNSKPTHTPDDAPPEPDQDGAMEDGEVHSQTALSATGGVVHDASAAGSSYQSSGESETVEVGGYIVRTVPVGPAPWEGGRRNGRVSLGTWRAEGGGVAPPPPPASVDGAGEGGVV